jgi:Xaa-Pro aminopeptidase
VTPLAEIDEKQARLVTMIKDAGLGGVLLATHHNIAWLTGGRSNRVDASREAGTQRLLVTADGRRFVLANAIEMPRLRDEVLAGLGFEPIEYAWADDQDPSYSVGAARTIIGGASPIGADWLLPDTAPSEARIARVRVLLTNAEVDRYRKLGNDCGIVVGDVCRRLRPGEDEREIAATVMLALTAISARAIVLLVGADDRIGRYRHPVPTATKWERVVLVAVCAERDGLVACLSRIVATKTAPADLEARTRATASVFARLLDASRPGATGAHLFTTAADGYRAAGYQDEEKLHHQGGATGYRAREWVAHPRSQETVQARQALAWNPSITGTKIEDTALVVDDRVEVITSTPGWPSIEMSVRGETLLASDVLRV